MPIHFFFLTSCFPSALQCFQYFFTTIMSVIFICDFYCSSSTCNSIVCISTCFILVLSHCFTCNLGDGDLCFLCACVSQIYFWSLFYFFSIIFVLIPDIDFQVVQTHLNSSLLVFCTSM